MDPHKTIWLQPSCQACAAEDRSWCQDNVWEGGCEECGTMPVKYVLAPDQPAGAAKLGELPKTPAEDGK